MSPKWEPRGAAWASEQLFAFRLWSRVQLSNLVVLVWDGLVAGLQTAAILAALGVLGGIPGFLLGQRQGRAEIEALLELPSGGVHLSTATYSYWARIPGGGPCAGLLQGLRVPTPEQARLAYLFPRPKTEAVPAHDDAHDTPSTSDALPPAKAAKKKEKTR